jgi:polar amino acid transport system permease protein
MRKANLPTSGVLIPTAMLIAAATVVGRTWLPSPLQEVLSYVASSFLLTGALTALEIAALALLGGVVLGLGLALMRLSALAPVRKLAWCYIAFMRGTPIILQIVFLFDALPAVGIKLDSFTTAVLGFMLNEAAFSAEIIRGGIISVDRKQSLAAASLGMSGFLTLRRIILPQAMRVILPGMGNQAISLVKGTSIASVIFVNELTFRSQQIVGQNFQFFTVFAAAGILYLSMTGGIGAGLAYLENRFNPERERGVKGMGLCGVFRRGVAAQAAAALPPVQAAARASSGIASWMNTLSKGEKGPQTRPFVQCENVHKSYGEREILRGVDLKIMQGEVVVLMGPSGSGKSTLLKLVNHLEQLEWGEIKVDGKYVGYEKRGGGARPIANVAKARADARIGMVFQHFNLFDHLSVLENVMEAPVHVYGEDPDVARQLALDLLETVGLGKHADHLPHRLSGGQQQRVAIARALAVSPRLMLFDEPTSALDPELVGEVLAVIRRLADSGMTMMIVTHEVRFAREVADRIVFMDEGQVVESGPPEEVLDRPKQERTRRFLRLVEGEAA